MKIRQFISIAAAATLAAGTVSCGDSSSSASTRVSRVLKLVDEEKYSEASSYVTEHSLKDKELSEIASEMQSRIDKAVEAYMDGSGEYDTAYSLISCAQRMNIPDLIVPLSEASTKLEKFHTSKEAYMTGLRYYDSGNYVYALQYFDQVGEEDQNYSDAQTHKEECLKRYREELEQQVKEYMNNGDYQSAMSYLENCRYSVSDCPAALELLNTMIADVGVNGVLGEAQALLDQGDLAGALERVEEFEDDHNISDSRLDDFSEKAKNDYLEIVLRKAEEQASQQNYLGALKMIENAQEVVSDARLDALKEKILAEKPTYLSEIYLTNSKNYKLIDSGDALTDTVGNSYPVGNLYLTDGYECYGEYNLGYRYNRLSGTIAVENSSYDASCVLRIIGDDVTLYSVNLRRAMTPTAFDVDVSSVNWLKITVSDTRNGYCKAILADCKFNDGNAQTTTTSAAETTTAAEETTTTASAEE